MIDLLSVSEAAAFVGLTPQGLRRHIASGRVPVILTIGGKRLIRPADLDSLIVHRAEMHTAEGRQASAQHAARTRWDRYRAERAQASAA